MTTNGQFDRDLERWLEAEAPMSGPTGLHEAVIDRARTMHQRPAWLVAVRGGTVGNSATTSRSGLRLTYVVVVLALMLAALVAVIAAGALRRDPFPPPGRNGAIAYAVEDASGSADPHAHVMNADGSEDREIAQGSCPTYSSRGTAIAYRSGFMDTAQVVVANPDGSSPQVVPDVGDSDYALSPDGTQVAWFKRLGNGISRTAADGSTAVAGYIDELWISPVMGGPAVRVVTPSDAATNEWYQSPVWSPDGRHIAFAVMVTVFSADNAGAYRTAIDTVNVDGSDRHRITARPGTDGVGVSWSPDGRTIAYAGLPDGSPLPSLGAGNGPPDSFYPAQGVFVVSFDGTGDHALTATASDEWAPEWSPDGSRLAYEMNDGSGSRLAVVPMASAIAAGPSVIGPAVASGFIWSPDGTALLWIDTTVDNGKATSTSIRTQDARFQRPAAVATTVPSGITCVPSWQRLDPGSTAPTPPPAATTAPTEALPSASAVPSLRPSAASFVSYLHYYGQLFTLVPVPATGVVSASTALAKVRDVGYPDSASPDPVAEAPVFGIVTCVDPSKNCAQRGLVRPGDSLFIWLIVFPTVPEAHGGSAWATVDATTGSFINGAPQPDAGNPSIQPSQQQR